MLHDLFLRHLSRSLALLLVVMAAACGGGDKAEAEPAVQAAISIASPEDGATVESTFPVTMEAEGFAVEAAGEVADGVGHFHLMVDGGCVAVGEQIPADETHIHLADGASETELTLPAGEHTLCLQAGDGAHAALDLIDEITVTVAGGDDTTTQADEHESVEDWLGTYEGEVVWDCGAAGTHRGTLEADVLILTYYDGSATLEAEHTVTGSCADTGSLTVELFVRDGERTASGFRFPSDLWGISGSFDLRVNGDRAEGRLSGAIPGPGTMTIVFDLECTYGC